MSCVTAANILQTSTFDLQRWMYHIANIKSAEFELVVKPSHLILVMEGKQYAFSYAQFYDLGNAIDALQPEKWWSFTSMYALKNLQELFHQFRLGEKNDVSKRQNVSTKSGFVIIRWSTSSNSFVDTLESEKTKPNISETHVLLSYNRGVDYQSVQWVSVEECSKWQMLYAAEHDFTVRLNSIELPFMEVWQDVAGWSDPQDIAFVQREMKGTDDLQLHLTQSFNRHVQEHSTTCDACVRNMKKSHEFAFQAAENAFPSPLK